VPPGSPFCCVLPRLTYGCPSLRIKAFYLSSPLLGECQNFRMRRRRWRKYGFVEDWYGLETFLVVSSRVRNVIYGLIVVGALLCAVVLLIRSMHHF
jgi:hypothetical protein